MRLCGSIDGMNDEEILVAILQEYILPFEQIEDQYVESDYDELCIYNGLDARLKLLIYIEDGYLFIDCYSSVRVGTHIHTTIRLDDRDALEQFREKLTWYLRGHMNTASDCGTHFS